MKAQKIADGSYRGVYRGVEFGFRLSRAGGCNRHALTRTPHKWYGWSYLRDGLPRFFIGGYLDDPSNQENQYIDLFRPTKQEALAYLEARIDSCLGELVEDS
ncbi:hypothetical protein ES702_06286 [subsurface metagenome]